MLNNYEFFPCQECTWKRDVTCLLSNNYAVYGIKN
jgi:hypothetical protein